MRALFLAGLTAATWTAHEPPVLHAAVPLCSPLLALIAVLTGTASVILLPAALIFIIAIFKKRSFCRWLCPAGTCFEAVGAKAPKRRWIARTPPLGLWFLAMGLGAALVGFPLWIVLDPLAIFSGAFGWVRNDLSGWEKAGALVFPVMVLMAAAAPWLWCSRLCPLGALQDVIVRPFQWIKMRLQAAPATLNQQRQPVNMGRRIFMGLGIGAGYRLLCNPARADYHSNLIRPPATGGEADFLALCVRCGACARVCPSQIIKQSGAAGGFAGLLAPELDFSRAGCAPECTHCGAVCPTGAIPQFTEKDKFTHPLGVAVLKKELCVLTYARECGVCLNACPHRAINIVWDPVEMESVLAIDAALCTGCGICQYVCPERPAAIVVVRD